MYKRQKADGQGNLWVLESWVIFTYDLPEDFDPETDEKYPYITDQTYHGLLRRLDPETGAALEERDLTEALSPLYGDLIDWLIDGEGRVYLATEAGLTVLDASGQELAVLEGAVQRSYSNGGSSLCRARRGVPGRPGCALCRTAVLVPDGAFDRLCDARAVQRACVGKVGKTRSARARVPRPCRIRVS